MLGTTDDRYFEWLYELVGSVRNRNPEKSYWSLCRHLYETEFVWLIANDDNRVEDGKELRLTFIDERGDDGIDPEWMSLGCSMLEMLVALSRRASFESNKAPGDWFRLFLQNLGLGHINDSRYNDEAAEAILVVLEQFIYRTYSPDGTGGLFPLQGPCEDQRKVELWYQLSAYLLENPAL